MDEFNKINQGRVPSPATARFIERAELKFDNMEISMNEINTKFQLMQKDIKSICEKLDENKEEHKQIMDKIDVFLTGCDNKYATKTFQSTIEKIGWAILFLIIGALVAAFFKLVLK
jgi:hypothetical protein